MLPDLDLLELGIHGFDFLPAEKYQKTAHKQRGKTNYAKKKSSYTVWGCEFIRNATLENLFMFVIHFIMLNNYKLVFLSESQLWSLINRPLREKGRKIETITTFDDTELETATKTRSANSISFRSQYYKIVFNYKM